MSCDARLCQIAPTVVDLILDKRGNLPPPPKPSRSPAMRKSKGCAAEIDEAAVTAVVYRETCTPLTSPTVCRGANASRP